MAAAAWRKEAVDAHVSTPSLSMPAPHPPTQPLLPELGRFRDLMRAAETQALQEQRSRSAAMDHAVCSQLAQSEAALAEQQKEKRGGKKTEEIVTVTRRPDAEPLNKRPITMREIFPKEFWRV